MSPFLEFPIPSNLRASQSTPSGNPHCPSPPSPLDIQKKPPPPPNNNNSQSSHQNSSHRIASHPSEIFTPSSPSRPPRPSASISPHHASLSSPSPSPDPPSPPPPSRQPSPHPILHPTPQIRQLSLRLQSLPPQILLPALAFQRLVAHQVAERLFARAEGLVPRALGAVWVIAAAGSGGFGVGLGLIRRGKSGRISRGLWMLWEGAEVGDWGLWIRLCWWSGRGGERREGNGKGVSSVCTHLILWVAGEGGDAGLNGAGGAVHVGFHGAGIVVGGHGVLE